MKGRVVIIGTRGYPSYCGGFEAAVRKLASYLVDLGWNATAYGPAGARRRTLGVAFSSVTLVLLSPVLLAVAIAIKLDGSGPMDFRKGRVGRGGERFVVHKPRSMSDNAEVRLGALRPRSTNNDALFKLEGGLQATLGRRKLRRLSLDELPQFWPVLRGHMSLVGPRPHLERELAGFPDDGLRRQLIKPGVTGLWQVNGRSSLSLEESIRLAFGYVENSSLLGVIANTLKAVRAVARPDGAH